MFDVNSFLLVIVALALAVALLLAILFVRRHRRIEQARRAEIQTGMERLNVALRATHMGTWDWDIRSDRIHWSDGAESILGLERSELPVNFSAYLDPLVEEERERVQASIDHTLSGKQSEYHVIHSLQTKSGEQRWLEGRGLMEYDKTGNPIRLIGVLMDATARVQAENERALLLSRMEKNNSHLSTAARVSKICNSILDPAELIQRSVTMIAEGFDLYYVGLFLVKDNEAVLSAGYGEAGRKMLAEHYFLPLEENSMIGWSILHGRARIAQKALNDHVRHQNPFLPETRSEMALPLISRENVIGALTIQSREEEAFNEGDISILQTLCDQLAIAIENARLFSNLQTELSQRQKAEHELQQERDFAVLVMSTLGQGVVVTDGENRLEYVNPTFARMLGYSIEDMLGKPLSQLIHPADHLTLQMAQRRDASTNSFEIRFDRANGKTAHMLVTSSPRQPGDHSRGTVAVMTDLTERKLAEVEREALIRELETKNAELERFTYTVSHDLKSPLITIRGFLGHLLDDVKKNDQVRVQDDARRIAEATNRMQRLLDELLELSRVGRLVNPPVEVPFERIVHEALSIVEGRIAARHIQVRVSSRLPIVRVDRVRLVEAMQNLLDNAAKFMGDQPSPLIEIGTQQDTGQTVFFVKDNGIGIDPRFHTKVFGLFDKLDPATDGTGVGLALVKRIIEVHGGTIWLESEPGNGATFFFTLPLSDHDSPSGERLE